jgi:hypothetical protein
VAFTGPYLAFLAPFWLELDAMLEPCPAWQLVRAFVLDTLFGKEEPLDYVSTTDAPSPPAA